MSLDPVLTVPCPTCRVTAGQPCRSRRAISVHQARRQALEGLGAQAGRLLGTARQEPERRARGNGSGPVPVLIGKTGGPVPDDDEERPPWE